MASLVDGNTNCTVVRRRRPTITLFWGDDDVNYALKGFFPIILVAEDRF